MTNQYHFNQLNNRIVLTRYIYHSNFVININMILLKKKLAQNVHLVI